MNQKFVFTNPVIARGQRILSVVIKIYSEAEKRRAASRRMISHRVKKMLRIVLLKRA